MVEVRTVLPPTILAPLCTKWHFVSFCAALRSPVITDVVMRLTMATDTDLGDLFDKLVNMKGSLGVREWGLSQATLEEAFIRICEQAGTK